MPLPLSLTRHHHLFLGSFVQENLFVAALRPGRCRYTNYARGRVRVGVRVRVRVRGRVGVRPGRCRDTNYARGGDKMVVRVRV